MIPNLLYAKAIGITSGIIVRRVGADAWTAELIGFIISLIFVLIMVYLGNKFPEETMLQYSEKFFGKFGAKILAGVLAIYFAVAFTVSANVLTLHVKEYLLPETPFIMLCIVYTVLCAYGAILGIEVCIRFAFFGFIMMTLINITMVLGTFQDFRLSNLQPFLDKGIAENLKASIYTFTDTSMAILTIGLIFTTLDNKKKSMLITAGAMVVGIISVIIWPIFETGVMGADVMKQFVIVCMQQVRCAQLTTYLPRYELIMVSFFVWGLFIQSAVMLYCSAFSIKHVTGVKKEWKIIAALIIPLILITNYLGYDHNDYIHFLSTWWTEISAILSVGIPLLLLIGYWVNKTFLKKNKNKNKKISVQ